VVNLDERRGNAILMIQQDHYLNTPIGEMIVSVAQQSDIANVRSLIEDTGSWLLSRGIHQWLSGTPSDRRLRWLVEQQWLHIVYMEGRTVATITLQTNDQAIWDEDFDDALYVHLLVVHRDFRGKEIGRLLLQWAVERAIEMRRRYLRLDCWAENAALRSYYEKVGFSPRGEIELNGWRSARYELAVFGSSRGQ
jgi:ribosomal protein S18 acetylase RimI-like enzyme